MTTRETIRALMADLNRSFLERETVIEMVTLALLCRQHVLLLGPPGTAKSALARAFSEALAGSVWWELLMTRFTAPDEVFGPVKFSALKADRFERETAGKLPEAHFPFVDEVFKAGSAILNTLLTAMNERLFHNGSQGTMHLPLRTMFGASNELPEGKELEALFDRFLVRLEIPYCTRDSSLKAIVRGGTPKVAKRLTLAELDAAQAEVEAIALSEDTLDAWLEIRAGLMAEGIVVSDRRWKQVLSLVRASAWLNGERETTREDLMVITDALWREPKERAKVARIVGQVADPIAAQAVAYLDAAREAHAKVNGIQAADRKAYLAAADAALKTFRETQAKLQALTKTAGKRATVAITDANEQIGALHTEMGRTIAKAMGIGARA